MIVDHNKNKDTLTPEEKVCLLLKDGFGISCDDTSENSEDLAKLPVWYDEKKFKRGQQFFHDNIFAMFMANFLGLWTVLLIPSTLRLLMFTNMSSTPMTAFKRYMTTIMHMYVWYCTDFTPGSDLWRSLTGVRAKHACASNRACTKHLRRIAQADMAITQFGFMGLVLSRQKMMGIHRASEEELEGFIHVWRVVGYLLGIQDRFNICSGTVAETKEICELLIEKYFAPNLREAGPDFKHMSKVLLNGMRVFNPCLNYSAFMVYLHEAFGVAISEDPKKTRLVHLTFMTKVMLQFIKLFMFICQFYLFRVSLNYIQYLALFLMDHFPFLAYFKFGYKNSHVTILNKTNTN